MTQGGDFGCMHQDESEQDDTSFMAYLPIIPVLIRNLNICLNGRIKKILQKNSLLFQSQNPLQNLMYRSSDCELPQEDAIKKFK